MGWVTFNKVIDMECHLKTSYTIDQSVIGWHVGLWLNDIVKIFYGVYKLNFLKYWYNCFFLLTFI